MDYPKWVYSSNIATTQANKRYYDSECARLRKALEKIPGYYKMGFREQLAIRDQVKKDINFPW